MTQPTLVQFTCPACSEPVTAGHTDDGRPTLLHPYPLCDEFSAIRTLRDAATYLLRAQHREAAQLGEPS